MPLLQQPEIRPMSTSPQRTLDTFDRLIGLGVSSSGILAFTTAEELDGLWRDEAGWWPSELAAALDASFVEFNLALSRT